MGTCAAHGPDAVLVDGEALLQRMRAHALVELVTSGEVQQRAEVLVTWYQSATNRNTNISCNE